MTDRGDGTGRGWSGRDRWLLKGHQPPGGSRMQALFHSEPEIKVQALAYARRTVQVWLADCSSMRLPFGHRLLSVDFDEEGNPTKVKYGVLGVPGSATVTDAFTIVRLLHSLYGGFILLFNTE